MAIQKKELDPSLKKEVFVRDHLAEFRTDLANRRTLLSHIRTALAFFAGGLALIKFSGHPLIWLIGWLILPAGVIILVQGVITYIKVTRAIQAEKEKTDEAERATL
ncbi:MAG: DUF202 domain-containing protein [Proteobacteria bacterium]|jgi:putative membrane protein|nr:DUF202 domain-containing protein [Desulfobacterales bacterium]MBL6967220.1 DUF202 domain-containing protein [Desulfobacteraceae bacterium]MBL7171625.1 DUF202 domain-containing protein [Desulfobacteraceae bacterium]MBU0734778.1 DUF202 domain-containing protein [Pseudomonadota bacterium]MBU1903115.1 DUF202 domain-containing protein [Pseudomonadota bacterium]